MKGKKIRFFLTLLLCLFFLFPAGCSEEARMKRHWNKAESYFSKKMLTEAQLEYKNVIRLKPDHAGAHYKLGLIYLRNGMIGGAYNEFSEALAGAPGMVEARIQLGQLSILTGDLEKARAQAEMILSRDAGNSSAHMLLSNIYLRAKNINQAIKESKKAVEGNKNLDAYLQLASLYIMKKDFLQAEDTLKAAVKLNGKALKGRFALAEFYSRSGKGDLAEREYIEAIRVADDEALPFVKLGDFYAGIKSFAAAEKQFLKGMALSPKDASLRIHLGDFYLKWGKKDKAENAYKIAADSKDPESLARLASFYIDEKNFDAGLEATDRILDVNQKSDQGRLLKGLILLKKKEFDQASNLFQSVLKDNPQSPLGHYLLAITHLENGNILQAKGELSEAVKLRPQWEEARLRLVGIQLREENPVQAVENLLAVLKKNPGNVIARLLLGYSYLRQNNITAAEHAFSELLEIAPDNPVAYMHLGWIRKTQKRNEQALALFEKALSLKPAYATPLQLMVSIYLDNNDYEKALERVKKQISVTPDNAAFYNIIGKIYEAGRDPANAEINLKKALALEPGHPQLHISLANFYAGQKIPDKAKNEYIASLSRAKGPDALMAHLALGIIYEKENKFEEAVKHYENALKIDPGFAPAANNLAFLYSEQGGNIDLALSLAQKARERNSNDPDISDTLGWIYVKKNVPGKAIPYLEEASAKLPDQPLIRYHLGMAYYREGKYRKAIKELKEALDLNPDFPDAQDAKATLHILETLK